MRHSSISRRRVQPRLIRLPRLYRPLHLIIDLQYHTLRAVLAILFFFFALHYEEGLHNVVHILMYYTVEVEIGCIQFATQEETPLFVPAESWAVVAAVFVEGFKVPGSIGEFKGTEEDPVAQMNFLIPTTWY